MTLLEEYERQNTWRDWERYLKELPLTPEQTVWDLGCSIGAVTKLLARRVGKVIGFDGSTVLLEEARRDKPGNCAFIDADIMIADPHAYEKCDGIWMSFTLAYMKEPGGFITRWMKCLKADGWVALADIDGLFTSHLPESSRYYGELEAFENASGAGGVYDFRIGRKLRSLMEHNGLEIIYSEEDWYDRELNFKGPAEPEIALNWEARLERMAALKTYFGDRYPDFCREFMAAISDERHEARGGVRFIVGAVRKAI